MKSDKREPLSEASPLVVNPREPHPIPLVSTRKTAVTVTMTVLSTATFMKAAGMALLGPSLPTLIDLGWTEPAANLLAVGDAAFALGKDDQNANKSFSGNRYSSVIYGKNLTARSLGALLAHYENKVMFQGFLWNINSFDQEGVQLGKVLANQVLSGDIDDPILAKYAGLFGIM